MDFGGELFEAVLGGCGLRLRVCPYPNGTFLIAHPKRK